MTADIAEISSSVLTARVSSHGAELQSLSDAEGRDLLWDGNPAFWQGRAPILFPIVGMLEGGHYRLDGVNYEMPKHGFARHSRFALLDHAADMVTYRLSASDQTRAIYPFEFQLDIRFVLSGAALSMEATIANLGDVAMPASFGFHPAFRWPLPYGQPRGDHRIEFERSEPAAIRRINADGLLLPEGEPTPVQGNTLSLRDDLFVGDAIIFDNLHSRKLSYGAPQGPQLEIEFGDFPLLGVWTKPGADFICIEPWQGVADPAGYQGDFGDKPGVIVVPAGSDARMAMHVRLVDR
jgi:galactose mutarotase-like enzyme